jgi:hypothetical protein
VFGDIAAGAERFLHRGFYEVAHRTASFSLNRSARNPESSPRWK